MIRNPLTLIDAYKADHRSQYPKGTELVFSNLTPRASRQNVDGVIFFGLQYWLDEYLTRVWNNGFFNLPKEEVVAAYQKRMQGAGLTISYDHIEALHDLGYLPLEVWALPEGTECPIGVPALVMWNTDPNFAWLTNYLETSISCCIWGPTTSATTARQYRKLFDAAAAISGGAPEFVDWQGHDFSARGMFGHEAAAMSGAGHLTSFTGSDTIWAIDFLEEYYDADPGSEIVGGSVPATEHSVMSIGSAAGSEREAFRRLITEVYPAGPVSIVSDTYDYWKVWTEILPSLKDEVMAREGVVVCRPDSGDPVKIICGDPDAPTGTPAHKGSFQLAWEVFGGVVNEQGYKQLDPHIGLIYGDSITIERATQIVETLLALGFVPSMVFGIGSFTYTYVTRDTHGFAMKATASVVNGELIDVFKDPVTDSGTKKSARGLLSVTRGVDGVLQLNQGVTWDAVKNCEFIKVFSNGVMTGRTSLAEVRARVQAGRS